MHFSNAFPSDLTFFEHWLFDGNLGVRFFFVISGFLITHLLLEEFNNTGTISLKRFYMRRSLRILPVYFSFLTVMCLFQAFSSWHQPLMAWVGNLTFTSNYTMSLVGAGAKRSTGHLWSLAVEEQFYLFWPIILRELGFNNTKRQYCFLGALVIIAPISRIITQEGLFPEMFRALFQGFSFFNYCDSLSIGCISAIFFTTNKLILTRKQASLSSIFIGFALIMTPYICGRLNLFQSVLVPAGNFLQAIGFAILLIQSILFPEKFKPLNSRFLTHIGVLSYSIYVWQQICWSDATRFSFSHFWFVSVSVCILTAYGISFLSYYGLEKPLVSLRNKFRNF